MTTTVYADGQPPPIPIVKHLLEAAAALAMQQKIEPFYNKC